jgi:ribosomal-protein-alanine N-acetyltransferase
MLLPEQITTPQLILRPYQIGDVDDVLAYATNPEWARFLPTPFPYQRTDAEQFIAGQILQDRTVHPSWAIVRDRMVIGGINLRLEPEHRLAEMGYAIAQPYWGQGLTTEAARAVIDAAFSSDPNLNRVRAIADSRNIASLRVMKKLGMAREGELRQNRAVRDQLIDEVVCGILRSEWEGNH